MPELPEVETIRRVLAPQLTGRRIARVCVNHPQPIARPDAPTFARALTGQTINALSRRGKFLSIEFVGGDYLRLHLRMTGCLLLVPPDYPVAAHTHVVLVLADGHELRFIDPRRFGRMWLMRAGEADDFSGVGKLGPEPFDAALTADYLRSKLGASRRPIKEGLLDQSVLAGIGNIYSDEILFTARIDPALPGRELEKTRWERLAQCIPERLRFYIETNAISPVDYLAGGGTDYRNTPYLQVYGHAGAPCPRCGMALEKRKIGGRSSVYCPICQK